MKPGRELRDNGSLTAAAGAAAAISGDAVRLLLVEDETLLAKPLARGLREEGYATDVAATGREAFELVEGTDYDLIVLDLGLPDCAGLDLLRRWRSDGVRCPVLILTARDGLEDKLRGLDGGGDDYLTKPFAFAELVARLRTLLRRREAPPVVTLELADLVLDRTRRRVERGGRPVELTPKEFALLEFFLLHPGVVLDRNAIAEHVWDYRYEARTNVIDVIVGRLRKKLGEPPAPRLIHTVKGVGYALRREAVD